ncbi:MAG: phosphatase PAP2 family protein [Chitinophagaceae bacterium]
MQLVNSVKEWDTNLFIKINSEWTNSFLDNNFPWYRDSSTWIPLYFFLLLFMLINFGWKIWPWIVFFIITVTITDQASSSLFKEWINRIRPCNDPLMFGHVRLLLNRCPSSQSFPSSHATNHFGMAIFMFITLKKYLQNWSYLFLFWAATISYGQIYVGVHYPLDTVGGAVLGSLIGLITAEIFNKKIELPPLLNKTY